ncbi:MAG TPA: glycosyltransferase family 8 protein [Ruminococcaceae bacterium]|nr:glycosyltransferase family 8 protein [Oscillospiraceae bacterium]
MNILCTLNRNYLKQLVIMLYSIEKSNPQTNFDVYIANSSLTGQDFDEIKNALNKTRFKIIDVKVPDSLFEGAPVSKRYPKEMYYRIFAAQYLPKDLDRVLYLDPDIIVLNPLDQLYSLDFNGCYLAACTHIRQNLTKINEIRLNMPKKCAYINSGIILMNLELLREQQDIKAVYQYIEKYEPFLLFPDQDVINGLYAKKTLTVNSLYYNLSDKVLRLHNLRNLDYKINIDWVRRNTVIVHYCGRNKPWKESYNGKLGIFYYETESELEAAHKISV